MLQLKNPTPLVATLFSSPDPDGVESLFAIVKGTFELGSRVGVAGVQAPIMTADRFHGDPLKTSIALPADIGLAKPSTDVLLLGHAHAPPGRRLAQSEVVLRLGPIQKRVAVFGERRWTGTVLARASAPEPFEKMPLVWERAFGGMETLPGAPARIDADDRNPVGTGFRSRSSPKRLEGSPLPNLEDPNNLIRSPADAPVPAGFGAICPHWKPRVSHAGTYDAAWQKSRAPYLPADFNSRYLQIAPGDQQVPGYLKGGEPVEVTGASLAGPLRFHLPAHTVEVRFRLDSGEERRPANLDTVIILPDENRLILVWRAALACDKRLLKVREVEPVVASAA